MASLKHHAMYYHVHLLHTHLWHSHKHHVMYHQYKMIIYQLRLEIIWQGLAIRLDMYLQVLELNNFIAKDQSTPNQVVGIPPTKELFSPTKPTNPNLPISYKILFWHNISYSVKNAFHFVVSRKKTIMRNKFNTTMKRILVMLKQSHLPMVSLQR